MIIPYEFGPVKGEILFGHGNNIDCAGRTITDSRITLSTIVTAERSIASNWSTLRITDSRITLRTIDTAGRATADDQSTLEIIDTARRGILDTRSILEP